MFEPSGIAVGQLIPDAADYLRRTEDCIALLSPPCGLDGPTERARFAACHAQLAAAGVSATSLIGMLTSVSGMPVVYELALSFGDGKFRGFGYMTQGASAGSVVASMRELLRTTLGLFFRYGGAQTSAELLADLVARAFPETSALEAYQGAAQAMITCFIPRQDRLDLKCYFNTRLLVDGAHAQRVASMLEHIGIATGDGSDFAEVYDALYDQEAGARFCGVGIDIDGSQRAKLYVRVDTPQAIDHLGQLAARIGIEVDLDALRAQFDLSDLANEVEVALALRADGPSSLKLTYFFPGVDQNEATRERVGALLVGYGYDRGLYDECMALLRRDGEIAQRAFPLHGLGLEFPQGQHLSKVNLYLQAAR